MNIALIGYGKMGSTIERLAEEQGHRVVFTKGSSSQQGDIQNADVAIDFSVPEAAFDNIRMALEAGIPVVSGTTGWLDRYNDILAICAKCNGSLLYASNFSVGVNLFFEISRYAADLLATYNIYKPSITEVHHTQKKDAPSGTAISLAEAVCHAFSLDGWSLGNEDPNKLPITAVREGDIKGTHELHYRSNIDEISLIHKSNSRDGFAKGAILAAEWLLGKKGVYTMKDVLGLNHGQQQ